MPTNAFEVIFRAGYGFFPLFRYYGARAAATVRGTLGLVSAVVEHGEMLVVLHVDTSMYNTFASHSHGHT